MNIHASSSQDIQCLKIWRLELIKNRKHTSPMFLDCILLRQLFVQIFTVYISSDVEAHE